MSMTASECACLCTLWKPGRELTFTLRESIFMFCETWIRASPLQIT